MSSIKHIKIVAYLPLMTNWRRVVNTHLPFPVLPYPILTNQSIQTYSISEPAEPSTSRSRRGAPKLQFFRRTQRFSRTYCLNFKAKSRVQRISLRSCRPWHYSGSCNDWSLSKGHCSREKETTVPVDTVKADFNLVLGLVLQSRFISMSGCSVRERIVIVPTHFRVTQENRLTVEARHISMLK